MIITFASSKGGVGKSTATACVAGAFAKAGSTVHIIDLDNNQTVSRWFSDKKTRPRNITVSTPNPEKLTEHLQEVAVKLGPDIILIDIAGTYERALTHAIARAHLTIIPAGTSEADIYEAGRVAQHLRQVFAAFGKKPLYKILLTRIQPIISHAQRHAYSEINRLKLPLFRSLLAHRAAYEEIGLSGLPPHFADPKRETVAKAITELECLKDEIEELVGLKAESKSVVSLRKSQAS
jgi:chromosome partitioning protein